jgi:SsrA-binding protein
MKGNGEEVKLVQKNRKAWHDYEILDKYEAGLVLAGSEVKSVREGRVNIQEAHAKIRNGEAWVVGMDIALYANAGPLNHDPLRTRKLLLKRREINRIAARMKEKGVTMVPLALYFKRGLAKLEVGLARGKREFDKRESIKKRENDRDLRRRMMKS